MPSRLRRFAGCGPGERKDCVAPGVRPVPSCRRRYPPLEAGPAGFPFPILIASWMPPTPGGGYEPSRPAYAPFVTSSDLLRHREHSRSLSQPSRARHLAAPEVSVIQLQRRTLLAPEQLWRGYVIPGSQNRVERHRSSLLYPFPIGRHVTHLGYILIYGHEKTV